MKKLLFIIIPILLIAAACHKDKALSTDGKGGAATLRITPRHHGKQIDSLTVYIKYNAQDAPADSLYDDSARCVMVDTIPVATFTQLKAGSYYIYGHGYDPSILEDVRGGVPYTISSQDTLAFNLPVTEGD